ncbi:MAG: hypothetical protein RLZZ65_1062 [Bacteroidota bacterium]|jgi:hypothetical protein
MKSILLSILGLFIGAITNGLIVQLGTKLIAGPAGQDLNTEAGLKAAMPFMEPKHFLFPFLAHALGTFVGAFFVSKMKVERAMIHSMAIGFAFLAGGVMMVVMLPNSPLWFIVLDLVVAYLPVAYLGYKLGNR